MVEGAPGQVEGYLSNGVEARNGDVQGWKGDCTFEIRSK
jgi:hypothetical protein